MKQGLQSLPSLPIRQRCLRQEGSLGSLSVRTTPSPRTSYQATERGIDQSTKKDIDKQHTPRTATAQKALKREGTGPCGCLRLLIGGRRRPTTSHLTRVVIGKLSDMERSPGTKAHTLDVEGARFVVSEGPLSLEKPVSGDEPPGQSPGGPRPRRLCWSLRQGREVAGALPGGGPEVETDKATHRQKRTTSVTEIVAWAEAGHRCQMPLLTHNEMGGQSHGHSPVVIDVEQLASRPEDVSW